MLRPPGVGFVSLHEVRVQFEVLLSRANPDLFSIYWDLPSPRGTPYGRPWPPADGPHGDDQPAKLYRGADGKVAEGKQAGLSVAEMQKRFTVASLKFSAVERLCRVSGKPGDRNRGTGRTLS